MLEVLKQLGLGSTTPFIYAAGTYGFFHYLDKQASPKAKKAIAGWFKPLEYDRAAVAAATVEIFDRLYTTPLLCWRAALRSALLTVVFTLILALESYGSNTLINPFVIPTVVLTNVASDYISLFFVRGLLVIGGNRPIAALVGGPLLGMCVVALFSYFRQVILWGMVVVFGYAEITFQTIFKFAWNSSFDSAFAALSLPALAVHLWLPLFGFGLLCVNVLNYLFLAIGGMQWFLKRGNEHPLDAVGFVLGAMVFVGAGILQLVR